MHTHERSDVRTHSSKCARDSRVYLVISILLSEQCICLRAARKFSTNCELRRGRKMPTGHYMFFLCIYMHIVCVCERTDAERNGDHRSRETGYKHLLVMIGLYGLDPGSSTYWYQVFNFFNGEV